MPASTHLPSHKAIVALNNDENQKQRAKLKKHQHHRSATVATNNISKTNHAASSSSQNQNKLNELIPPQTTANNSTTNNNNNNNNNGRIRMKTKSSSSDTLKNKIPLPPTNANNRPRTESISSARSFSNRSIARSTSTRSRISNPSRSNGGNGGVIPRRSSITSIGNNSTYSQRSISDAVSLASSIANNSKMSSSSPKFLNWAFQNVSSNLVPSDYEIEDYDQSVLVSRQRSMSDSVSTLNNDSESSYGWHATGTATIASSNNSNSQTNSNQPPQEPPPPSSKQYPYNGILAKNQVVMDTINSQYDSSLFDNEITPMRRYNSTGTPSKNYYRNQQLPYQHPSYFDNSNNNTDKTARQTPTPTRESSTIEQTNKISIHEHARSHSADFVELLQQQYPNDNDNQQLHHHRRNSKTESNKNGVVVEQNQLMETIHSEYASSFDNNDTPLRRYSTPTAVKYYNQHHNNQEQQYLPSGGGSSSTSSIFDNHNMNTTPAPIPTLEASTNNDNKNKEKHEHSRSHSADFVDFLQQQDTSSFSLSKNLLLSSSSPISIGLSTVNNASSNNNNRNSKDKVDNFHFSDSDNTNLHLSNSDPNLFDISNSSPLAFYRKKQHNNNVRNNKIDSHEEKESLLKRHMTEPLPYTETIRYGAMKKYDSQFALATSGITSNYDAVASTKKQFDLGILEHRLSGGMGSNSGPLRVKRSFRRRVFLLLTEPQTSILSVTFFVLYFIILVGSVLIMMMQTTRAFQYTPKQCEFCGNEEDMEIRPFANMDYSLSSCECPPIPIPIMIKIEDWMIYFFSVEWILRVASFEPLKLVDGTHETFSQFLFGPYTVLDFLSTFPYYLVRYHKVDGIVSLRLLRFFRLFQLLRLKKYDVYLTTMSRVLVGSMKAVHIYLLTLTFLAAVFASIIFWFEKGEWKYTDLLEEPGYAFVRIAANGYTEELSPFHSIPSSFWWFFVSATTAGYGDAYPTSTGGKFVAVFALLCGVLVIAFPVSIFTELWQKEIRSMDDLRNMYDDDDVGSEDDSDDDDYSYQSPPDHEHRAPIQFVSATSTHHKYAGGVNLDTTHSFTSMILQSHADEQSHHSNDSFVHMKSDQNRMTKHHTNNTTAELTSKDIADLRRYMESIDTAQDKIRGILAKIETT